VTYAPGLGLLDRDDLTAPSVWLDWDQYLRWLSGKLRTTHDYLGRVVRLPPPWAPGQHAAFIGPTGEGKTTHAVGVLETRKWVLALDPKGEDETLSASGYQRVGSLYRDSLRWRLAHRDDAAVWRKVWEDVDAGRPARVIIGGPADDDEQFTRLKQLISDAVDFCRYAGGWTQYCDEFEVASSRDMFALAPTINLSLITARRRKISVVNSYQAQAWVSKHAIRQARKAVLWQTGDRDMIRNVARAMGRDWRELAGIVDALDPFYSATVTRGPRWPVVLTRAPKVNLVSYAERTRRKMMRAKTPEQLGYGRCFICWKKIKPCGPGCWHRVAHRCRSCTPASTFYRPCPARRASTGRAGAGVPAAPG
jgi:hypothetical protein